MVLNKVWRKQQRFWQFERMTLYLLIASIVLLLLPLICDALEWGRDYSWDTHSGRYTTRILAATVLFWAWACRIILLFQLMRFEKQARETPDHECFACGYDLRGTLGANRKNCPECGVAIAIEMLQDIKE